MKPNPLSTGKKLNVLPAQVVSQLEMVKFAAELGFVTPST